MNPSYPKESPAEGFDGDWDHRPGAELGGGGGTQPLSQHFHGFHSACAFLLFPPSSSVLPHCPNDLKNSQFQGVLPGCLAAVLALPLMDSVILEVFPSLKGSVISMVIPVPSPSSFPGF